MTEAVEDSDPPNADVHNMFLRCSARRPQFDLPDSEYAFGAVGHALVMALSEVSATRPADPIEFLALRLLNYGETRRYCEQRDAEFLAAKQDRLRRKREEAERQAAEAEIRRQRELEEQRRREELERKRRTVPLETFQLPIAEQRDKAGATKLHEAVKTCSVEEFLDLLHEGHSFCARDAHGNSVRDAAVAAKNEAVVKEIDNMIVNWIKEDKVEYLRWLLAAGYGANLPNMKKPFGPKLKGAPEGCRQVLESVAQFEARYRELWKLCARGTKEHLEAHCQQVSEQFPEDLFSRNRDNLSAVHVALLCKNEDAVQFLAEAFPKVVDMPDGFGRLPIHFAHGAGQNFVEIVKAVGGAREDVKDAFGFSPSVYAKRFELLPEAPNFESPDLVVTAEEDDASHAADGEQPPKEDADQTKLTPINEDEAESS